MGPSPAARLSLALSLALLATACLRDNNGGKSPKADLRTKVGNNDPRGVDDQPDWDAQARELKQRVESRMPAELPTDPRAACTAMMDEALAFYIAVEPDPERRSERMGQMHETREADIEGCVEETSIAAAVCVTVLLEDRDSEFPWLLDQCSRAYPKEDGDKVGTAPKRAEEIELAFVGDIIFGRYREDNSFDPIVEPSKLGELAGPFLEIEAALQSDVLVGNLETPVIESLPTSSPIGSKYRFGGGREDVKMLASAGFTVLSLANNHYYDLREEGQVASPKILADEGILPIGASRTQEPIYRVETHLAEGWKVGFVAVTNRINAPVREGQPQVPYIERRDMVEKLGPLVEKARADHDLIILVVHWGDEYAEAPNAAIQRTARELIDGGVDMVIGHHPHVLQGIERHGEGLIAYSLGNFLFEHTGSIPRLTGVLRTRWTASSPEAEPCLAEVVFHPAYMKRTPYPHPKAATGGMAKRVRSRVVDQAKALGTDFVEVEGGEDLHIDGLASCS